MINDQIEEKIKRVASINVQLAVNARVNCGRLLTVEKERVLDNLIGERQDLIEWLFARDVVLAMAPSVYIQLNRPALAWPRFV